MVINRVRVLGSGPHTPTQFFLEYTPPPPPGIFYHLEILGFVCTSATQLDTQHMNFSVLNNLVPRVFRLFVQRGNAGETLGISKKFNFFDWLFRNGFHCFTAEILRYNKIRCPQSLPGVAPLTKKPEDSGYEIGC